MRRIILVGLTLAFSAMPVLGKTVLKEWGVLKNDPEEVIFTVKPAPLFKLKADAAAYRKAVLAQDSIAAKQIVSDGLSKGWVRMTFPKAKFLTSESHNIENHTYLLIHYIGDTTYWFADIDVFY